MAKIHMVDSLDEAHPIALPTSAAAAATPAPVRDETPFHETQMVFAKSPQTPVIDTDAGVRSGYAVKLSPIAGKNGEFEATVTGPSGVSSTLTIRKGGSAWSTLFADGDPL